MILSSLTGGLLNLTPIVATLWIRSPGPSEERACYTFTGMQEGVGGISMSPLKYPQPQSSHCSLRSHCSFRLIRSLRLLRPLDALSSLTPCTLHVPLETTRACGPWTQGGCEAVRPGPKEKDTNCCIKFLLILRTVRFASGVPRFRYDPTLQDYYGLPFEMELENEARLRITASF